MEKLVNVVMLPTEKASNIYLKLKGALKNSGEILCYSKEPFINGLTHTSNQHLSLTSDDEIKKGDWYIHNQISNLRISNSNAIPMDAKKVIATTDKSLIIGKSERTNYGNENTYNSYDHKEVNLPQIPESFIKAYVEAQGAIKEVLVEYEKLIQHGTNGAYTEIVKTLEDNTVIIHIIEK